MIMLTKGIYMSFRYVCPLVFWLVCRNFLKGREVILPCSYRSTFLFWDSTSEYQLVVFSGHSYRFHPLVDIHSYVTFLCRNLIVHQLSNFRWELPSALPSVRLSVRCTSVLYHRWLAKGLPLLGALVSKQHFFLSLSLKSLWYSVVFFLLLELY